MENNKTNKNMLSNTLLTKEATNYGLNSVWGIRLMTYYQSIPLRRGSRVWFQSNTLVFFCDRAQKQCQPQFRYVTFRHRNKTNAN